MINRGGKRFKLVYVQNGYRASALSPDEEVLRELLKTIMGGKEGQKTLWCLYNDKGVLIDRNTEKYL